MTDFRMANIPKQEAYDLLRDWIKLVARHTNPDQNISELLGWLWKLKPPVLDSETGLVPCGCGGKAETHELFGEYRGTYMTDCKECATGTTQYNTEKESQDAWNTAMGYKGGAE